jgi:hypothetical protein
VTLNPPKLSNCSNSTTLTFFFPKCPQHIFYIIFKKKKSKKKKKQKTKIKRGKICWGGRTTPLGHEGGSATLRAQGVVWPPLGPPPQEFRAGGEFSESSQCSLRLNRPRASETNFYHKASFSSSSSSSSSCMILAIPKPL